MVNAIWKTAEFLDRRLKIINVRLLELELPKLLLITASAPEIRRVRRSRVLNFQQITMPYLAARVPAGWDVIHVDEEAEEIDWNFELDVVGITFHTWSFHFLRCPPCCTSHPSGSARKAFGVKPSFL